MVGGAVIFVLGVVLAIAAFTSSDEWESSAVLGKAAMGAAAATLAAVAAACWQRAVAGISFETKVSRILFAGFGAVIAGGIAMAFLASEFASVGRGDAAVQPGFVAGFVSYAAILIALRIIHPVGGKPAG